MTKSEITNERRIVPKIIQVIATNSDYMQLCRESMRRLPRSVRSQIQLLGSGRIGGERPREPSGTKTLLVSRLADLPFRKGKPAPNFDRDSNLLLFIESLPVQAMPSHLLKLNIRNPDRIHLAPERNSDDFVNLVYRLFSGIAQPSLPSTIVDAWFEPGALVLLSPKFERLAVPIDKIENLVGANEGEIRGFELDEDGRFLYWPHKDVHLGWDQFLQIVDPAADVTARNKSISFNKRFGRAIRTLRRRSRLRQSDIPGLTERHLRRIEQGRQAASKRSLTVLAAAHKMELEAYLSSISLLLPPPTVEET